jgi:hypothetical protein
LLVHDSGLANKPMGSVRRYSHRSPPNSTM